MPAVTIIQNGRKRVIPAEKGAPLAAVLAGGGAGLDMPCGGNGLCRKCSVKISGKDCLACRTAVTGDMEVELQDTGVFGHILTGAEARPGSENPMYTRWGLSVDIGTTTICAALVGRGGAHAAAARKNPQSAFGADVINRIGHALGGKLQNLRECICAALREMISELAEGQGISPEEIDAAVVTGNTAMLYLLTGQPPETLSRAPFEADRLFGEYVAPDTLGLGISESARIYLPRCISAFVGADITTAILACGMCESAGTSLLADIGTNGEIALWHNGALRCASTAAGPAFEGGGLSCGVYGIRGAVDRVWAAGGKICSSTIGNAPATGICGSGIVDALAVMLRLGIIDETGAFESGQALELQNGVTITAGDVRKIQLAKGSMRAGIETLIEASGVGKSQVGTLYLAGGFGNYLDLGSAAVIGLIPPELLPVTRCVGNAAHAGAAMLLQDETLAARADALTREAITVPLDANPVFTDNYMKYMVFEQI